MADTWVITLGFDGEPRSDILEATNGLPGQISWRVEKWKPSTHPDHEKEILALVYASPSARIVISEFDYAQANEKYELQVSKENGRWVYALREKAGNKR
jgi:hypothetical protein